VTAHTQSSPACLRALSVFVESPLNSCEEAAELSRPACPKGRGILSPPPAAAVRAAAAHLSPLESRIAHTPAGPSVLDLTFPA